MFAKPIDKDKTLEQLLKELEQKKIMLTENNQKLISQESSDNKIKENSHSNGGMIPPFLGTIIAKNYEQRNVKLNLDIKDLERLIEAKRSESLEASSNGP